MSINPADGSGYFLYHSIGQYPGKAEELGAVMAEYATVWGQPDDAQWPFVLGKQARFLELWRNLINADEGTLTTATNVTSALYSLIGGLPDHHLRGKKLLVAGDCFPSLHFLLNGLQSRFGFELVTVPLRAGAAWVEDEDVIAHWDGSVGLALLTHASSTSSHLCDLDSLVAHGRKMGSLVGVDVTQSIGLMPYSVKAPLVDFTVSSTLKWLCGTSGAGIIQVDHALLETCQPELRGWFSQPNPFSWDFSKFAYADDIRRFDNGTPSAIAAIASIPALEWHARQAPGSLLAHNRILTDAIIGAATDLGLKLATPSASHLRGGSVMIRLPEAVAAPDLVSHLRAAGIFTDNRSQILRLSPGNVTTLDGVEKLLSSLRSVVAGI